MVSQTLTTSLSDQTSKRSPHFPLATKISVDIGLIDYLGLPRIDQVNSPNVKCRFKGD
jgi:hypothetical protein